METLPFLERLNEGRPLLADGAMGTMLHGRGLPMDACFDELNLSRPELIYSIHRAYVEAGAELIETNTFAANRFKLADCGAEDKIAEINRAGAMLARKAVTDNPPPHRNISTVALPSPSGQGEDMDAERTVYVAGSVGPLGVRLQPYGRVNPEDARAAFAEQIAGLAEGGVDVIILETFTDLAEILQALAAAREAAPHLPVICEMTFTPDDRTPLGYLPGRVARDLRDAGADVIGVNCSGGPTQISRVLQMMRLAAPDALLSAMPNAGFPETVGGRTMYPATVEYFADYALTFKAIGAAIIGGCCGTTPEHIAAMRRALDDPSAPQRPLPHAPVIELHSEEDADMPERPTEMAHKLASGKFVVSVEMAPPRSYNLSRMLASAQLLQDAGADVINVADTPTARMRISAWAVCHLLQTRLGVETVLHFPTRGRNMLRIQGDLLGAHAMGLRNLFVVMGDPTRIGDYPDAMDHYDIVPSGLIRLITQRMNAGLDQAGNSIGQPTTFNVGCALNMAAQDVDAEIGVLRKKMEAGANFALGQAVFDPAAVERFLRRYEELQGEPLRLPVLMGVMPLYSLKHAIFLNNEVPGISIPEHILQRIEGAGEDAAHEGVRVALELMADMRDLVQGAYIIPAYGRYDLAADVIDGLAVPARR